jgi:hypothetical protein
VQGLLLAKTNVILTIQAQGTNNSGKSEYKCKEEKNALGQKGEFMFIFSVRASTLKLCALIALTLVLLVGVGTFAEGEVISVSALGDIQYSGIKTNEDRVAFIERLGVLVADDPLDEKTFTVPENFDRIVSGYNELQKRQGLDVSRYAKKKVTRYTYKVENYDFDGEVYVNLFIFKNKIIACDICSAEQGGFVAPLTLVDKEKLK